jgi:hypothetical protein
MEQSTSWEVNNHLPNQEIPPFYVTKIFITCSQEPATGCYLEPDESSPQLPTFFPKRILISCSQLCLGLAGGCLIQVSRPNFVCVYHLSHACYMLPPHPLWLFSPNNILWSVQFVKVFIMDLRPNVSIRCSIILFIFTKSSSPPPCLYSSMVLSSQTSILLIVGLPYWFQ